MAAQSHNPAYRAWHELRPTERMQLRIDANLVVIQAASAAQEFLDRHDVSMFSPLDVQLNVEDRERVHYLDQTFGALERHQGRLEAIALSTTVRTNWEARALVASALFHLGALHDRGMHIGVGLRRLLAAPYGPLSDTATGHETSASPTAFQPSFLAFRQRVGDVRVVQPSAWNGLRFAVSRVQEVLSHRARYDYRSALALARQLIPDLQSPTAMFALMRDPVLLDVVASAYSDPDLHHALWPENNAHGHGRSLYRALTFSREFKDLEPQAIQDRWPRDMGVDLALETMGR